MFEHYLYYTYLNAFSIQGLLYFSFTLFSIGFVGIFLNKHDPLIILLSAEIMFLGLSLNFIFLSLFSFDPRGQLFALFIIVIAAAESAVGLGILIITYRIADDINFTLLKNFRH